jgi:2-Cys peroxiredoxin 5
VIILFKSTISPLQIGDSLPAVELDQLVGGEIKKVTLPELFKGKKGIIFGVPGAFTPGCSKTHLPGYIADYDTLKAAGAEVIACVSVNDAFVMSAWGDAHGADGKVSMLADPRAELATALGFEFDASGVLGNIRCCRFSAVVGADGVLKSVNLEEGGAMTCSLSNQILDQLKQE